MGMQSHEGISEVGPSLSSAKFYRVLQALTSLEVLQSQVGWDSEQPDAVGGIPVHGRGLELGGL